MTTNAVTDGFKADTELLLNRFTQLNSVRFESFCDEWKRMDFQYVFCGYMCLSEMVQFLNEAFNIMKRSLLNATSHYEKLGALYLMYAMYFKQPPRQFCKFRLTMSEWMKVNQFYNEVCIFHQQASLIFWKLLYYDAFRFVEDEHEYGFERFMQKGAIDRRDDGVFRKINPIIEKSISAMTDRKTGIIPALEILQIGYNEMKEHLSQTSSAMSATTIASDISKGLEAIDQLFKVAQTVQEDDESCDDQSKVHINTKRRQLKAKAFGGSERDAKSSKKTISTMGRTSIVDDGEFIKIEKAGSYKARNIKQFNVRETKTRTIKQLETSIDHEMEVQPSVSSSPVPEASTSGRNALDMFTLDDISDNTET